MLALARAIERTGVAFYALGDGATVRASGDICCEPDALVAPLPKPVLTELEVTDPVVVVEVLSPSGRNRDLVDKVANYARVPTIAHYLIVDPHKQTVVHHTRQTMLSGARPQRIAEPILRLDPPGVDLTIAELFAQRNGPVE